MDKPRVVIADTDENYIQSIELKFIEDFFDKVQLEIITDQEYFERLFMTPQSADILIVSEDLYEISLQKHNIKNIFVMTEQHEEDQTEELNITKIFKYSSIKGIFNEILGQSAKDLKLAEEARTEPQIVVVTSAAGGVGKTTVAIGMGMALAKDYRKVLYINATSLQSFPLLLKNPTTICDNTIYSQLLGNSDDLYEAVKSEIRNEVFQYLPAFKSALMSLGLSLDIYKRIAESARKSGEYDFIIVDTDNIFDEKKAELINIADKVLIVTKQSKNAVIATNTLIQNINGIDSNKYCFVCNDYDKNEENFLISSMLETHFSVNEYIEHMEKYEMMDGNELSEQMDIKKLVYLIE